MNRCSIIVLTVLATMAGSGAAVAAGTDAAPAPSASTVAAPGAAPPPLRWTTTSGLSGRDYRWSASRGSVDLGMQFEVGSQVRSAGRPESATPQVQTLPALNLGLSSVDRRSGTTLRQLAGADEAIGASHRVGIEWKPAESQTLFLRQGLGVRLSGDDRLTMRLRKGTLGLYMKEQF